MGAAAGFDRRTPGLTVGLMPLWRQKAMKSGADGVKQQKKLRSVLPGMTPRLSRSRPFY